MHPLPITDAPRALGPNGPSVFPLAYGCWRFAGTDVTSARAKLDAALEMGITLFDTADIYGFDGEKGFGDAETLMGAVFADAPSLRDAMVLASKGGIIPGVPYNSSTDYLIEACEASLKRLRVERLDLYQIHRPDLLAHPADAAEALTRLRDAGKITHVGVSNYTPSQFEALQAHLDFPILSHQPEFSAWTLDPMRDGILDQCMARGLGVLAWSPLAGGALATGEMPDTSPGSQARFQALLARIDDLAKALNVARTAVALAFVLAHPARIIPIIGTQNIDNLRATREAFKVSLTRADWFAMVEASEGKKLP